MHKPFLEKEAPPCIHCGKPATHSHMGDAPPTHCHEHARHRKGTYLEVAMPYVSCLPGHNPRGNSSLPIPVDAIVANITSCDYCAGPIDRFRSYFRCRNCLSMGETATGIMTGPPHLDGLYLDEFVVRVLLRNRSDQSDSQN